MAATPGMIGASQISGSLDAKNIVMGVLQKGIELSNLQVLCGKTQVPELTATIPIAEAGAVTEDLDEFEHSDIEGATFSNIDFSLKKDRIKFAVSDEAGYKSKAGDPLAIQKTGGGVQLAAILDKKIATAFKTSPQTSATGSAWDTVTNNPLEDIGKAVAALRPYKADALCLHSDVYAHYVANDLVKEAGTGNPVAFKDAVMKVPGLDLDVFINDNFTNKNAVVVATNGMPAVIGNGPVKVRSWDDEGLGAKLYQMDVFRQVKAPIYKTSGSLNMAVYEITAVIT
jgi:hypothetical protein